VYVTRTETLLKRESVLGERLYAVVVDDDEAIDINTPLDLVIAEAVMRWRQGRGSKDGPTY
jgi:N-acylneuraminate cytidylyltransferase